MLNQPLSQLDFAHEARNSEVCATNFQRQNFRKIHVPTVRWDLTTDRVLTMEFMEVVTFVSELLLGLLCD